jgi:DNA polymerase elongation subunit (family B)
MTYIDAFYDRKIDKIAVVERVNGKRITSYHNPKHVFYYSNPMGQCKSIYGHQCSLFSTNDSKKFRKELSIRSENHKIFESDINPVFRYLADNYRGVKAPELNICFFDIEVDLNVNNIYSPLKKMYAPTDNTFCPITAITMHTNYLKDANLITLVLCPPSLTKIEANKICENYENTILFSNEADLLNTFLDLIEDSDLLTGWNCLPLTSNIWLADRITQLGNIKAGNITNQYGKVLDWHDSGTKRVNKIILENGMVLEASDEHIIPVMMKDFNKYTYPNPLIRSHLDKTTKEIKQLIKEKDCYLEVCLNKKNRKNLSYRDFVCDYFHVLMDNPDFDIVIKNKVLKEKIKKSLIEQNLFKTVFPYPEKFFRDYPKFWASKNFSMITHDDLLFQIKNSDSISVVFKNNRSYELQLDRDISDDICHLLGLIFTDGTFDRKSKLFTFYSSEENFIHKVKDKIFELIPTIKTANKKISKTKKNSMAIYFRRGSDFGVLAHMIYDKNYKKTINVEMISRLSNTQFSAFFSGLVDGDGWVRQEGNSKNKNNNVIGFCNYNNCINKIQELLFWNGVYATSNSKNNLTIYASSVNKNFISGLTLWHSKKDKIPLLCFSDVMNSPNKKLRRFILEDKAIVRIKEIIETDDFVAMGDITTEQHYFDCSGIKVHNSEGYDIPYSVNRVERVLGKEATKRFCLFDQYPKPREYKKFQKVFKTYELVGRAHLDYLILYQKHTPHQQQSYKLDFIGEIEIGENKVPYDGTLDQLWRNDFDKFIAYNRQDVDIMVKIDKKKKFVELSNQIAHANCVLLKTTIGTVSLVEQSIINEMHEMGFIVPNRKPKDWNNDEDLEIDIDEDAPVVGAYVANPKIGLHRHVACGDINSLYPSAIRALHMSPETLIGQVRLDLTSKIVADRIAAGTERAEAWEGIFIALEVQHMLDETNEILTIDFEDKINDKIETIQMSAKEFYEYIFNPKNNVCITANGTIFRTDVDGIIPQLLAKWYAERKEYQAKQKYHKKLSVEDENQEQQNYHKKEAEYWDQMQYCRKILLNSLYGALLNESLRFYDERIGQSTTLSGRSIDKHMAAKINQIITGVYDYKGDAIKYCDTDSSMFSFYDILKDKEEYKDFDWSKENIIQMADLIMDQVNDTFPEFMKQTFNTSLKHGSLIKAGRDFVASTALFIKKKKYAVMMYDQENIRLDVDGKPGKMKIMGLDLKRSDTPKFVQKFLENLLQDILTDVDKESMYQKVKVFRDEFKKCPSWEKGSPKKVSNMTEYSEKYEDARKIKITSHGGKGKITMPGHVRASINWNNMCDMFNDLYVGRINDGTRIVVYQLKKNSHAITSIAFPVDEPHMPDWFKKLPFDDDAMEEVVIDKKLENLVGVLNWDLSQTKNNDNDEFFIFKKK